MTIIFSNCSSQQCNLITQTILQKYEQLNLITKIITHDPDQKVTVEIFGGVAEKTFCSDTIYVEIIDHENEEHE